MTGYTRGDIEALLPGGRWQADGEYLVRSPLREERTASFRINLEKASWMDFGTGDGGKLSELFRRLNAPDPWADESEHGQGAAKNSPGGEAEKAQRVKDYWNKATPTSEHKYLQTKSISINGLRVDFQGNLLVPGFNMAGVLASLERISPSGEKRHLGAKKDTFFASGDFSGDSPIFFAEGFATAITIHKLTDCPIVACFGPNLDNIGANFANKFPGRELVACPDADPAGEICGNKCRAIGMKVVELPPDRPKGHDWNDAASDGDIKRTQDLFFAQLEAARAAREPGAEPAAERSRRFNLQKVGDIPLAEPDFLVDGLIESDVLALFFGESGAKKSFVAFDLAASIATGAPFHDMPTREGAVIYIAGEGQGGMARRAKAWEMHRGISLSGAPLFLSSRAGLFMDETSALEVEAEVARVAEEAGSPLLVIIDTVARAMAGGDENSAKDTSYFVERVDTLRRQYGAAALLVHHSGLNDKGRLRGSSAWRGALDAEFLIEASGANGEVVTATCKKMKDSAIPAPFSFEAVEYAVLEGKKGPVTSLALEPTDKRPAREERLSRAQKAALDSFTAALRETPTLDADGRPIGLHLEDWRGAYYSLSPADSVEAKKKAFQRARSELVAAGVLKVRDDIYSSSRDENKNSGTDYGERVRGLIDSSNGTAGQNQNVPSVPPGEGEEKTALDAENQPGQPGHTGTLSHLSRSANYNHRDKRDTPLRGVPCPGSLSRFGDKETEKPAAAPQENEDEKKALEEAAEWAEKFPRLKYQLKGRAITQTQDPEEARELYGDLLREAFRKFGGAGASQKEPAGEGFSPGEDLEPEAASPRPNGEHVPPEGLPEATLSVAAVASLAGVDIEAVREELARWEAVGRLQVDEAGGIALLAGAAFPGEEEPGQEEHPASPPETIAGQDEPPGGRPDPQGRLFGVKDRGPEKSPPGQGEPTDRPRGKGAPAISEDRRGQIHSDLLREMRPRAPGGQGRLDLGGGPAPGQSLSSFRLFGRLEPGELPEDLRGGVRRANAGATEGGTEGGEADGAECL